MELEDAVPLTMIHQAIRGKTTHSLDECIQMEPQHINTPDDVGFAPLHWAVWKEDMVAFRTLIKASANVNQQTSHQRETPLHFACRNRDVGMARTLLDLGAIISSQDKDKRTALHYAINSFSGEQQEMDLVQMLLDAHADPNCGNVEGRTPLHLLFLNHIGSDQVETMARALIDAGANLEAKDMDGRTVLLSSCSQSCRNVPILIDLGANVKAVDDEGQNLLSSLAQNETDLSPSLLHPELLVGVDPDARDKYHDSPLDFLAERVRDSIKWQPPTIRVVVDMVNLILGTREANWEVGLFLDTKQELEEADGSHARMHQWVMYQRRLMQRDKLWGDYECEEDDLLGWYQDEYNDSSASDTDDDEQDWSDGEDSITFHDAHETLE